jgi:hypothetical protein
VRLLGRQEARAIARECGVSCKWRGKGAFTVSGTPQDVMRFRGTVSQDLGGLAYDVTEADHHGVCWVAKDFNPMEGQTT